ncbi:aspartyl/glutamyl-tRNA(Asn/Gln) amidotransferase subunit B [Candidatus Dependentiae bacterium Noda2021]|nr:aspartyl/glutamyl-tRNA(Asn/Gln) amidotransferase subunit B [Candidatus Dependentiae bacterium Noda2021]
MSKSVSVLDRYPEYEVTIGMEVHVQLNTNTKIFCTCANEVIKQPNTNICQICTGQPGSLPCINKKVIEYAVKAGLATNCHLTSPSYFARKHYFYPDLPKDYQITQAEDPICQNGFVPIRLEDGSIKRIRLMRIHMEEDAGKSIHAGHSNESFVDFNRAGTPLLEMVSQPDISSAYETKEYLKTLRAIVQYLGICSGNMEEGAFRADTNISVRKKGATAYGTKVELKNINSFKFIGDAIEHEIERQIEMVENGERVKQETRLWDTKNKKTIAMRSKEEAADYRYLLDPDLPAIVLAPDYIENIKKSMPELPFEKFDRLVNQKGLTAYEADILVDDLALSNYFEKAYSLVPSKLIINWILRDVMGYLKDQKVELADFKVTPERLAQLIALIEKGTINNRSAQEVFIDIAHTGKSPEEIVKEKGLEQIGSADELEAIIKDLIAGFPEQVAQYKSGKDKMFGFFVGQAMAKTKGKGDPRVIQELLKKHLS